MFRKILYIAMFFSSYAFASCPVCSCSESQSVPKGMQYEQEIKTTISSKIDPKISEISNKAEKVKNLQNQINEKLVEYRNLETHSFVINKQKISLLREIQEQMSSGIDISSNETKAIAERIKGKLAQLALMQGKDIEKTMSDYLK